MRSASPQRGSGSGDGIKKFIAGDVDFAVTNSGDKVTVTYTGKDGAQGSTRRSPR